VGTEVSGTIRSVNADFNDTVKKGQVLAVLDTDKLEAQRDQAKAALAVSRAELENARAGASEAKINFERLQRAFDASHGRLPSRQDLDGARAALDKASAQVGVAKANISKSEASLKGYESDLDKAIIRSPIDGLILDRQVEPGQTVAASLQAPILFTLAENLTNMSLYVAVDEADVGQVSEGQRATFVVDAYPDKRFPARISQVRFAPKEASGVVTYECILEVDNSDLLLRPGMTATADIVTAEVRDAVLAPNVALRFTPTGLERPDAAQAQPGASFISKIMPGPRRRPRPQGQNGKTPKGKAGPKLWVLEDGRPVARPVTTGPSDGVKTQIVRGDVAPGQTVVIGQEEAVK
jgi:HlyD family secretion protein